MSEGNQETICCGEVIGDDVQLWNGKKQVTRVKLSGRGKTWQEMNLETWKPEENLKHNKEPENKNLKT